MSDFLNAVRSGDAKAAAVLVASAKYDDRPEAIKVACVLGDEAVFGVAEGSRQEERE